MTQSDFRYDNSTGRGPGRGVRLLGWVVPGVRRVRAQAEPYAAAWRAHNDAARHHDGRRWIVLGDSMSQGVGAGSYDAGWVGQLRDRLAEAGHHLVVLNLSATGARVTDVVEQQLAAYTSLVPRADDLVTVLIGSNDLFAGGRVRAALPESFATLLGRLPRESVVAPLPQPRAAARQVNAEITRAEQAGLVRVVDMRTAGPDSWRGKVAADFFHPNEAGYAAIADAFEPVMTLALGSGLRPDGT